MKQKRAPQIANAPSMLKTKNDFFNMDKDAYYLNEVLQFIAVPVIAQQNYKAYGDYLIVRQ